MRPSYSRSSWYSPRVWGFQVISVTQLCFEAIVRRFRERLRFPIEFKRWRCLFLTMTLACFGSTVSLNLALPKARKFNSFWANDLKRPKKVGNMAFEANSGSCGNWFLRQCNVAKTFFIQCSQRNKQNAAPSIHYRPVFRRIFA